MDIDGENVLKRVRLGDEDVSEKCAYCGKAAKLTEKIGTVTDVDGKEIDLVPYHFCSHEHQLAYYSRLEERREGETEWHRRRRLFYMKKLMRAGVIGAMTNVGNQYLIEDLTRVILVKLLDVAIESFTRESPIACGANHTVLMDQKDYIYVTGDNTYGQLGIGLDTASMLSTFTPIYMPGVCAVACGAHTTLVLTRDAATRKTSLWVCGWNKYGALGFADIVQKVDRFRKVRDLDDVVQIRASNSTHIVLRENGTTIPLDRGPYGSVDGKFVIDVSLGERTSVFLHDDNSIYMNQGRILNYLGPVVGRFALNDVPIENIVRVIASGSENFFMIDIHGAVYMTEKNVSELNRYIRLRDEVIRTISFGPSYDYSSQFIALLEDGRHIVHGYPYYGELTRKTMPFVIRHVTHGDDHIFAMTDDGRLYVWGAATNREKSKYDTKLLQNTGILGIIDENGRPIDDTKNEWIQVPYLPTLVRTDNKKARTLTTMSLFSLLNAGANK